MPTPTDPPRPAAPGDRDPTAPVAVLDRAVAVLDRAVAAAAPCRRDATAPLRVHFVCTGNICRSPVAAVVTTQLAARAGLAERLAVRSAGTGGWHRGEPADPRALASLRAAGYDGSAHRAAQWAAPDWAVADLVVALDRSHDRALRATAPAGRQPVLLRAFDPAPPGAAPAPGAVPAPAAVAAADPSDVPDPYVDDDWFAPVLDLITRCCGGLVAAVGAWLPAAPGGGQRPRLA